jgi:Fe-S-cluster containining protein
MVMETINDIIAEMRKDIPRVVDTKVILRNYADRIEKAIANCNQLKMREALEEISNLADAIYTHNECANENSLAILSMCDAALAGAARNCDLYKSEPEAYQAYLTAMKNATKKTYVYFEPWLFEKAKGFFFKKTIEKAYAGIDWGERKKGEGK